MLTLYSKVACFMSISKIFSKKGRLHQRFMFTSGVVPLEPHGKRYMLLHGRNNKNTSLLKLVWYGTNYCNTFCNFSFFTWDYKLFKLFYMQYCNLLPFYHLFCNNTKKKKQQCSRQQGFIDDKKYCKSFFGH